MGSLTTDNSPSEGNATSFGNVNLGSGNSAILTTRNMIFARRNGRYKTPSQPKNIAQRVYRAANRMRSGSFEYRPGPSGHQTGQTIRTELIQEIPPIQYATSCNMLSARAFATSVYRLVGLNNVDCRHVRMRHSVYRGPGVTHVSTSIFLLRFLGAGVDVFDELNHRSQSNVV